MKPKNPKSIRDYWRDAQRRCRERKRSGSVSAGKPKADPNLEQIPEEMSQCKE
jgi:hypothetical protein